MANIRDLTGKTFGRLTVLERAPDYVTPRGKHYTKWKCICECGNVKAINSSCLIQGLTRSCGCLNKEQITQLAKDMTGKLVKNLTGRTFGRLTIIERGPDYITPGGQHKTQWKCMCSCGNPNPVFVVASQMQQGKTQSCGCLQREKASQMKKKYNSYEFHDEYVIGFTSKGEIFLFDREDYMKVRQYCWYSNRLGYLYSDTKKKKINLHRLIMGVPKSSKVVIDHMNHYTWDNRKANLRIVSHCENTRNSGLRKNNTSGGRGVTWCKRNQKWHPQIVVNGKSIYLGFFDSFEREKMALETRPTDTVKAERLRAYLHGFPEAGATFPDTAFTEFVERAVIKTGEYIDFTFTCSITLRQSIAQPEAQIRAETDGAQPKKRKKRTAA